MISEIFLHYDRPWFTLEQRATIPDIALLVIFFMSCLLMKWKSENIRSWWILPNQTWSHIYIFRDDVWGLLTILWEGKVWSRTKKKPCQTSTNDIHKFLSREVENECEMFKFLMGIPNQPLSHIFIHDRCYLRHSYTKSCEKPRFTLKQRKTKPEIY